MCLKRPKLEDSPSPEIAGCKPKTCMYILHRLTRSIVQYSHHDKLAYSKAAASLVVGLIMPSEARFGSRGSAGKPI